MECLNKYTNQHITTHTNNLDQLLKRTVVNYNIHTLYCFWTPENSNMDDGTEEEFGPGEVGAIPPGHNAMVLGNERLITVKSRGFALIAVV